MAGVSFRSGSQQYTGFGGATLVIAKPAGTVTGDLMIVSVLSREGIAGDGALITPPAGWTAVLTGPGTVSNQIIFDDGVPGQNRFFWYVAYRVAQGGEGASYTFTISGANPTVTDKMGTISTYQNPAAVTPIAVVGLPLITYDVNANLPFDSITPGVSDSLIVNVAVCAQVDFEGSAPSLDSDEAITTHAAAYRTRASTPLYVWAADGLRDYVDYDPGHVPNNMRAEFIAAFGDLETTDYPWHLATATGALVYDGHTFTPRWFTGALSLVLKNSLVLQTQLDDLVFSQDTASVGATTIYDDGAVTYDPLTQVAGDVDSFLYAVDSPRVAETGPISVTITSDQEYVFGNPHPFKAQQ